MQAIKCPKCQLANFADASFCKRCGLNLKEITHNPNPNLFRCPDCGNSCSKTAPNCPSCGKVFNAAPVYITQPPKKTSATTWVVLALILCFPLLCCVFGGIKSTPTSSVPAATPTSTASTSNDSTKRQTFANGLQQMAIEAGKSTKIDTEGDGGKTLSIRSDVIEKSDCIGLATSVYGQSASSVGFIRLVCRNTKDGDTWSYPL